MKDMRTENREIKERDLGTSLQSRALRQKTEIFNLLLEKLNVAIFEYDVETDTLFLTRLDAAKRCQEKAISCYRQYLADRHADDPGAIKNMLGLIEKACNAPHQDSVEYQARFWTDSYRWYRTTYKSLFDEESGTVYAIIGYTEDVHDEVMERNQLLQSATCDSLTKLYNRETTEQLINEHLKKLPAGSKGILFMLDIDDFKQINDTLGHMAGDGYLRALTEAIRSDFRDADIMGRIGGDEFVVFWHGQVSIDTIERRAQCILDLFMRVPHQTERPASCSIGIAVTSSSKETYGTLRPKADEALYLAKSKGKGRYRLYGEEKY